MSNPGEERIAAAFARCGKRAAFMPYVMAGFPDLDSSLAIGLACAQAGADIIELGIPFSDPLADGPVIHAAATAALAGGTTVARALEVAAGLTPVIPVVVMAYINTVLSPDPTAFADRLASAGVSGLIVPDLPFEEAEAIGDAMSDAGIALVGLIAPNTPDARLVEIVARARGFVYVVSVIGTTGERSAGPDGTAPLLARARAHTSLPLALGFGISTPEHAARAAAAGADGVIVASRLIRALGESHDPVSAVTAQLAEFAAALAVE